MKVEILLVLVHKREKLTELSHKTMKNEIMCQGFFVKSGFCQIEVFCYNNICVTWFSMHMHFVFGFLGYLYCSTTYWLTNMATSVAFHSIIEVTLQNFLLIIYRFIKICWLYIIAIINSAQFTLSVNWSTK